MEFLYKFDYWILIFLAAFFYVLFFISGYLRVQWNMMLKRYSGYGLIVYFILLFAQYGWSAGFISILILIPYAFLVNPLIKYFCKKLNPVAFATFNIAQSIPKKPAYSSPEDKLKSMLDNSEKAKHNILKLQTNKSINNVLKKYGKPVSEIENIYQILLASGVNDNVASSIVNNPKYLQEFLELKDRGISDMEAAFQMANRI